VSIVTQASQSGPKVETFQYAEFFLFQLVDVPALPEVFLSVPPRSQADQFDEGGGP
jgi:hypothetical protein